MSRIRSISGVAVIGLVVAIPASAQATSSAPARNQVYVIQGVPGAAVDVSLDGKTVKKSVAAKAIVGPLKLTSGRHTITFASSGWRVTSTVKVARRSSDVVLHWPASSTKKPVVSVFENDLASVGPDRGRLTVAHTAVVPPADIRVNHKVLFANIANGQFATAEVPAATYSVEVVPTGQTGNPLLGPVELPVAKGQLTRVFAIGQPSKGSMDAVVQVLPVAITGSTAPGQVDAGSAGLVATSGSSGAHGTSAAAWAIACTLFIGAGTITLCARRRRDIR